MKNAGLSDYKIAHVDILKSGLPFIENEIWRLSNEILEYQPFIKNTTRRQRKNKQRTY
jgi:hypothetical protein